MLFQWIKSAGNSEIGKHISGNVQRLLTPSVSTSRIVELDALRGIAALSVVFYHYTTRYDQIYGHSARLAFSLPAGRYGVLLFFMISGFVILMSLERTRQVLDFVVSRIIRIYPTYWVAIAFTFSVVAIIGLPGREVSVTNAVLNGLMFHPFLHIPHVDGVYWTLLVELIFYVLMAGIFAARLLPYIEWVVLCWLGLNALENHNLLIEVPGKLKHFLLLEHAHLFIMGIVLYRLRQNGGSILRYSILSACFASQIALYPEVDKHLTVLILIVVFLLINAGKLRAIAIPPLLALGTISYPLYLIHQNTGYIVIRTLENSGISPTISILAATSVTIALSVLMTYYVEQTSLRWLKTLYRQWQRTVVNRSG